MQIMLEWQSDTFTKASLNINTHQLVMFFDTHSLRNIALAHSLFVDHSRVAMRKCFFLSESRLSLQTIYLLFRHHFTYHWYTTSIPFYFIYHLHTIYTTFYIPLIYHLQFTHHVHTIYDSPYHWHTMYHVGLPWDLRRLEMLVGPRHLAAPLAAETSLAGGRMRPGGLERG